MSLKKNSVFNDFNGKPANAAVFLRGMKLGFFILNKKTSPKIEKTANADSVLFFSLEKQTKKIFS